MNIIHNDPNTLTEPSLGIVGCIKEYQQMRSCSVYWLSIDTHINALRFGEQILAGLDPKSCAVVVGCNKDSAIISALEDDQGPADLRSYSLKGDMPTAVLRLTEQLDRKLNPIRRLIVCLLPIESLSFLERKSHLVLKSWRDWCETNGCTLLVLAYGEHAQFKNQALAHESRFLSGLAHLRSQTDDYVYQVDYWINNLGVQAAESFLLQDENTGFALLKTSVLPVEKVIAEVFLQRSVLEGAPIYMAEKWRVAEDWKELVSTAQAVVRGTFVFALYSAQEFESLARTLYNLRQQRGAAVILVVSEMKQVLRNQEVQLLLQCGAALVVSADTHLARFFSMLENLQNHQESRPLIQNLESAIVKIKVPDVKGILSLLEFKTYLDKVLANTSVVETGGILVTMSPTPALSVEQVMGQLRIVRKGDVACAVNGVVYLFLFGCQLGFVEIALQRVFSLPFKDIISKYQVHSDHPSIQDRARRLQVQKTVQAFDPVVKEELTAVSAQAQESSEDTNISIVRFKPQLKPLQLRKYSESKL